MIEQHSSLSEKFLRKWFWLYLFSFVIAPIGYIIKIIISWELSVEEVWILYWVISLITLLSSFSDFWMTESLKYFIPKYATTKSYDKIKSILSYAFFIQILTWIIIALFLFSGADFLGEFYFKSEKAKEVLQIFCLFFLWMNIFRVFNTFFLAVQNTFYNRLTDFIRIVFILISVLTIYFLDMWSLSNYSISWIIWLYFWIISVLYIFYIKYNKKYFKKEKIIFSKVLFKKIFSYAIIVFIWAQAGAILSQIDMQMVIYILWPKEAWYYTNYLSIVSIPFMIIWPIMHLLFPVFSELHEKKDFKKIRLIKQIFQKNFIIIVIVFNILFFVFAETIAYILFWEKFIESWNILRYSILFLVFNFLLQINFHILAWIGKVMERVKIIFIAIVFNFFMNLILIKLIWVYWAALATAFGWILIWILSEIKLGKEFRSKFDYIFMIKNIILSIILWTIWFYYILDLFIWLWRIESLIYLSVFSLIYYLILFILNNKDLKELSLLIKRR